MTVPAVGLKQRVISAGGWSIGSYFIGQLIRFGGNLVFTRFLLPDAFGLMAVVTVIMVGVVLISDWGISQGIIRSPRGSEPDYLNTAWTIQILQGVFLAVLMIIIATLLPVLTGKGWIQTGSVYANSELPWLIIVFSLTPLIHAFDSTKVAEARRKIQLSRLSTIEIISQCSSMLVMIGLLTCYRSVWILVVGAIVTSTVRCVLTHVWLSGTSNRLRWEVTAVRDIIHFGAGITVVTILGFLSSSGDRLILGSLVSSKILGIYSIAYLLANTVTSIFNTVLSNVIYPALSEVTRERPENISKVYFKLQGIADVAVFSVAGLLFALGDIAVRFLYDDRYAQAGYMLQILAFGLVGLRYSVVEQFYLAKRAMRHLALANLLRSIVMIAGLPLGYSIAGMKGALVAIVLSQFAGWPVALKFKRAHGLMDIRKGVPSMLALAFAICCFVLLLTSRKLIVDVT